MHLPAVSTSHTGTAFITFGGSGGTYNSDEVIHRLHRRNCLLSEYGHKYRHRHRRHSKTGDRRMDVVIYRMSLISNPQTEITVWRSGVLCNVLIGPQED